MTGTPGVGKSDVASHLSDLGTVREVEELARDLRAGSRRRGNVLEVDLRRLSRAIRSAPGESTPSIIVGHLSHLLPVRAIVVLRCHPRILLRRLADHRSLSPIQRWETAVAEAIDLVLVEAVSRRIPLWEIDTTHGSANEVANVVRTALRRSPPTQWPGVDWLSDSWVREYLSAPPP